MIERSPDWRSGRRVSYQHPPMRTLPACTHSLTHDQTGVFFFFSLNPCKPVKKHANQSANGLRNQDRSHSGCIDHQPSQRSGPPKCKQLAVNNNIIDHDDSAKRAIVDLPEMMFIL